MSTLENLSRKELQDLQLEITYALSRHVPDMKERGFRILTSYGELHIGWGTKIPDLVERLLNEKLARVEAKLVAGGAA